MTELTRAMRQAHVFQREFDRAQSRTLAKFRRDVARMVDHECQPADWQCIGWNEYGLYSRSGNLLGTVPSAHEAARIVASGIWGGRTIDTNRSVGTTDIAPTGSDMLDAVLAPFQSRLAELSPEERRKLIGDLRQEIALLQAVHERNRFSSLLKSQAEREAARLQYAQDMGRRR